MLQIEAAGLHDEADGAGGDSEQSECGISVLFVLIQQEIKEQNAEREKEQLHLGQDGDAVAVNVVDDRVEEREVHGRLLDLQRRSGDGRGWRYLAIRLVKAGIHLLDDALDWLFDVGEEWFGVDANPAHRPAGESRLLP